LEGRLTPGFVQIFHLAVLQVCTHFPRWHDRLEAASNSAYVVIFEMDGAETMAVISKGISTGWNCTTWMAHTQAVSHEGLNSAL
jgi:hypothetical protein